MSAAPFAIGAAVTCSLGGPWERLQGVKLQVLEIRRASTYPGGWAVRLGGAAHLSVPASFVGCTALEAFAPVAPPGLDDLRAATRALQQEVQSAVARADAAAARAAAAEGRALAAEACLAAFEQRLARLEAGTRQQEPTDTDAVAVVARLARYGFDGLADGVAARHGLAVVDICTRSRTPAIVAARDELLHAIRVGQPSKWSYPRIGHVFGMEYTSVHGAVRRHEARLAQREAA